MPEQEPSGSDDKVFFSGRATYRVWNNGDYEIRADNAVVAEGNIYEEEYHPIPEEVVEAHLEDVEVRQ